jgi:hypothetical protein
LESQWQPANTHIMVSVQLRECLFSDMKYFNFNFKIKTKLKPNELKRFLNN